MRLILLHALPLDERMWQPQLTAYRDLEVEAPRLYGRPGSIDDWASQLLKETQGDLVVVGASMGGYCALRMAAHAPHRVRGVVLAGSRPDPDSRERRAMRAELIELVRSHGAEGLWASMRDRVFGAAADPAAIEAADAIARDQRSEELVEAIAAIRDRVDSSAVVERLGDHALVVLGDSDPFVSPADVPGADVHLLPECGHLPSMERPEAFDELVRAALGRWC